MKPAVTSIAPWFGSNRTLAENVGKLLRGCSWVGVPFAGGMSELLHITAPSVLVSDLHTHVLNLAAVTPSNVVLYVLPTCQTNGLNLSNAQQSFLPFRPSVA
jgi:hypothetical protein